LLLFFLLEDFLLLDLLLLLLEELLEDLELATTAFVLRLPPEPAE